MDRFLLILIKKLKTKTPEYILSRIYTIGVYLRQEISVREAETKTVKITTS